MLLNAEMRVKRSLQGRMCVSEGEKGLTRHEYFEAHLAYLWNVLPYRSLLVRNTQLSFCLLDPSLKPTWINAINLQLAACHHCASPPIPRFCSRSWWIFARWIPVTSMRCEVDSNNKRFKRRDFLHCLIQYIPLRQFWWGSNVDFFPFRCSLQQCFWTFSVH